MCATMPLTAQDGALLGGGMWLAAAATFFYKKKQTLPFKASTRKWTGAQVEVQTKGHSKQTTVTQVAYFLAWPTLGTAVILVAMPSKERTIAVSNIFQALVLCFGVAH